MKFNKFKIRLSFIFACIILLLIYNEKSFGQLSEKWHASGSNLQNYEMGGDPTLSHGTENCSFIKSKVSENKGLGTWMTKIEPGKYLGKRLRMTAYVKATNVENWAGLWMRVDGPDKKTLNLDNMKYRAIRGTVDWKKYSVVLDIPKNSSNISLGVLLNGNGNLLIDDLKLEIVGRDIPITVLKYGSNEKVGKYAKVNGIKMYYEIYGKGKPLVLIHGNGANIESMGHQIQYFSEHYKVIVADSRGHGKTGIGEGELTYKQMAADWAELLEYLEIDSTYIIGWSDGGIIGLLLAINNPSKVKMLAAMGANLQPDTSALYPWAVNWIKKKYKMYDNKLQKNDTTKNWKLLKQYFYLMMTQPNIPLADLHKISVPVLVLAGDKDMIREEHTVLIFQNIPKAHLCIFPGQTHFIPITDPELFNQTIYKFFTNPFKRPDSKYFIW